MAAVINTNISSLTAQRNLSMSQTALATSMQRLSSGLRINSAKDDAAGLAISERFTTQVRGLNQAARNANDGISLSQTAEGALGEMTSNLQRIRELAVQSANSTNSASDRAALDLEVQQRLAEIDRVATQSSFNGVKILDGTFGNATFQVGANVGDTISIALGTSMRQSSIGALATVASTVDLNTLATASPTAATYTTGVVAANDFSTVAAVAGTDTVTFAAPVTAADTVTLNGVIFTFADAGAGNPDAYTVVDATHVTVGTDLAADTATTNAASLAAAITAAKADPLTTAALTTVSATSALGVVTIADTAAGLAATVGRTLTESGAQIAVAQDATGSDVNTTANGTLTIGTTAIALTSNITNAADLITAINAGSGGAFTAAAGTTAETIIITSTATGTTAAATILPTGTVATTDLDLDDGAVAVAGAASLTYTLAAGGLSVAIGTDTAVNVAADDYTTAQSFVDAVNTAMGGKGYASLDPTTGLMTINSSNTVTIGGTDLMTLGLTAGTVATTGSLSTVDVTDVAGSNDAIQRVDSALTAVSTLRSTFGAIQNRFESVIANLSTTSENLNAARSRIQDADFAIETANLSRAQILQQAGTAMVAQANQLPQGVLALLRQ